MVIDIKNLKMKIYEINLKYVFIINVYTLKKTKTLCFEYNFKSHFENLKISLNKNRRKKHYRIILPVD